MRDLLKPVTSIEPRPRDPALLRYIRSYLMLRVGVGGLGAALPFILVLMDGLLLDGDPFPRNSLSAYYYSGTRDVLVGAVCATGVFLVAYKVAERNLDNTLSVVAGVAALGVALFPPRLPANVDPAPLQELLSNDFCAWTHFVSAVIFITALAVLSVFFGVREGTRDPQKGKLPPKFWRIYHWVCAGLIVAALLWMGVHELFDVGPSEALLYGEAVALCAFGASWLWKGLELDTLRGQPAPLMTEQ